MCIIYVRRGWRGIIHITYYGTLMYSTTSVNSEDIETAVIISIYTHPTYYRKTHPDRGIVFPARGTRLGI